MWRQLFSRMGCFFVHLLLSPSVLPVRALFDPAKFKDKKTDSERKHVRFHYCNGHLDGIVLDSKTLQTFFLSLYVLSQHVSSAVWGCVIVTATSCGVLSALPRVSMIFLLSQGEIRLHCWSGLLTVWMGLYP